MGGIAVLSDGGWGTSLALVLHGNGHRVRLWGFFPDYVREMRERRENPRFLPGIPLPADLELMDDLGAAVAGAEQVVLASPAQYLRGLLERLAPIPLDQQTVLVNVAKGIETGTLKRMSELAEEILGRRRYAVLSGPSHAEEVARRIPTAVVAASRDASVYEAVQEAFSNDFLRVYSSHDVTGVELGGALKNVLALAAGVCDGMGFGDNSKAAMMTRGIREMARLGVALGGRAETFSGLSGVGDLIVTCMSRHSRNRHVGEELGKGRALADIVADMGGKVAEGVATTESAYQLARSQHVDIPIIEQVYAGLYQGRDPREAVRALMSRSGKPEHL